MSKILTKTRGLVKTLLVAVGVSVVATTTANAQNNSSSFKGVEDLTGLTTDQIKTVAAGEYSTTDQSQIYFLYNVKTGKFINAGSSWSTHISLKDYPMAFWANTTSSTSIGQFEFAQNMDTGQGHLLAWMGGKDTKNPDNGVFIDRSTKDANHCGWWFEKVETDTKNNTYRIYTKVGAYIIGDNVLGGTNYYLCAKGTVVDQDKNVEAMPKSDITGKYDGYDTWRVLTMKQVYEMQKANTDNLTSAIDLSFKLKSPGFSRGANDIEGAWNVAKSYGDLSTKGLRFGLEKLYNTSFDINGDTYNNEDIYYNDYSYESTGYNTTLKFTKGKSAKEDYLRKMAKYFCVDVKGTRGAIYQDVKVSTGGTYLIECKGYSNTTKATIFAVVSDADGKENKASLSQKVFNQISGMSATEKEALHVSEKNMDYAGEKFYGSRKYINSVTVDVPDDGKEYTIRFGVMIGDDVDNNPGTADADEWTVFDDFRLLYASRPAKADLILDEDRADLNYLKDYADVTYKNKVLHLKKTYTANKWNTIVLPVSLTKEQYRKAFGANARLARLTGLTNTQIQFTTVDMDNADMADNATALEAYVPYIFFPTRKTSDIIEPAYTADFGSDHANAKVTIAKNHITIAGVSLATTADGKNDLSKMNTDTWVSTTEDVATEGTLKAVGTFARTFGTATQKADGTWEFTDKNIIYGRDNLVNCYFFDKGKMYHSATRPRGMRGFTCWFKPVEGATSKSADLYIDGISQGTATGINSVVDFGNETGKFAKKGIYNLHGQLISNGSDTTGLPAGIYIVNGKKCVVK